MTISRIRACQRYKVLLPHFQLDSTAKDLKFCSRTTVLSWLLKIWSSVSALPLCGDWNSASASPLCLDYPWCDTSSVPHFCSANSCEDVKFRFCTPVLPWLPKIWNSASTLLLCQDEASLPHFRSALNDKDVKFGFPNFCSARTSKYLKFRFRICSTRTSKDVKVHFRISSLPGLPKMWSSASALLLCLGCQRS